MQKCSFYTEKIQDEAIKYCFRIEFLDGKSLQKVFIKN